MSASPAPFVPGAAVRAQLLRLQRRQVIPVVVGPFLGLLVVVVAAAAGFGSFIVSPAALVLFAVGYGLSMLGVTCGYHRLLTHRSFSCGPGVTGFLIGCACMAGEGPPLFWVAAHRKHHQFSDVDGDPHSPHAGGLGFGHAHVTWMLTQPPIDPLKFAPDLLRNAFVMQIHKQYQRILVLGLVVPTLFGTLTIGGWIGALQGFLWGGLVRIFFVQHVTWCINSVCHLFGSRSYDSKDHSRNNLPLCVLSFGESWHNNHHAFPSSAVHGLGFFQIDLTWRFIRTLELLGLARDVVVPDAVLLARRLRTDPHPADDRTPT